MNAPRPPGRLPGTILLGLLAVSANVVKASPAPPWALQEPGSAQTAETPAGPEVQLGLDAAVSRAVARNPLTRAVGLDVERARVDLERFEDFWALPQVGLDGTAGLVPEARGDIFSSPDSSSDLGSLGPFFKVDLGVALPVYTFGRLQHARGAAGGALQAEELKAQRSRDELTLEVIKAYWGAQAAGEALELFREMRDRYNDELLPEVEEKLESVDIDPNDAYEIRSARYDIDELWLSVVQRERVLTRALAELVGEPPGTRFDFTDLGAPEVTLGESSLEPLQALAARRNTQLMALHAGVGALEEAMQLERSNRLPVILLGGGLQWAKSPARDDQDNPFVNDDFNYRRIGAALNMKWDLNFARHRIDYVKRSFERDATAARADALAQKVSVDVHVALEKVLKYRALAESARETRVTTRRWLRTAFDDFDLGLGEAQALIKAYRADYRLQGKVIETQYQLNVSLAELALVTGDLHTYLQWVADGEVALE